MTATRRDALALAGGALAAFSFGRPANAADPIAVTAVPIPLDERDVSVDRAGSLRWRGGLWLGSTDKRFGGWSDLWVEPGNKRLISISDRGWTLDAVPVFDGWLRGLGAAKLGRLIGVSGRPLASPFDDAEGLVRLPDGGFAVSLERRHRILVYPPAEPPFTRAPALRPGPPLAGTPANGGMEALTLLPGGALLTLIEEGLEDGRNRGFVETPEGWAKLHYQAADGFTPTGMCQLANGDSVVLERSFSLFAGGFAARLARVAAGSWRPGAIVEGVELARLRNPLATDNYEGVAATRAPDGAEILWLISDDNYMSLQRTLLVTFAL
jgi:hypothetical protein